MNVAILPERSARSCVSCAKRKSACDRNVPCGACVKRNQAATCSSAPKKRKSKAGVDPTQELDSRRRSALEELSLFRQTLDSLKARLPNLEYFVANSSLKDAEDSKELEEAIKAFGDPVTDTSAVVAEEGSEPSTSKRPALTSTIGSSKDLDPPAKKQKKESTDESEVNVQAAIDLEFSALGRPRKWNEWGSHAGPSAHADTDGESSPSHRFAVLAPEAQVESPVDLFPDNETLASAAPSPLEEDVIFRQGFRFGWHHSVIHAPTFYGQLNAFRELGVDRFDRASLAWMSSYFALLAISTKLLGPEDQDELEWSEEETSEAAARWFQCAVSCLYRHNFLQCHDFACLQTIALLVLSGRDAGSATLIASLLSSGISIAQDLGLHRLPSDEDWTRSMKGRPTRYRVKALIEREHQKRVLWSLVHSEWFAIPFKGYSLLARLRIDTPLPLNATDEDLATGEVVNRPRDEFTYAAWLLQYIEIGSCMSSAFESKDIVVKVSASQAYQAFLQADKQLEAILEDLPSWLQSEGSSQGMPESIDPAHLRSTFLISLHHKILSIHRPFLAKPSRATMYAFSHRRVVDAARAILREATRVRGVRIWTVLYHISVASFSMSLELFEQLKTPSPDNEAIRSEIQAALPTLDGLKQASSIAERGLNLVLPLLADEKRLQSEVATDKKGKRKSKPAGPARTSSTTATASPRTTPHSPSQPNFALPQHSPFENPAPQLGFFPFHHMSTSTTNGLGLTNAGKPSSASPDPKLPFVPSPYDPSVPSWLYGENFLYSQLDQTATSLPPGGPPISTFASYGMGGPVANVPHDVWGWNVQGPPMASREGGEGMDDQTT